MNKGIAAAALMAMALAGCGRSDAPAATDRTASLEQTIGYSTARRSQVEAGYNAAVEQCMRVDGFRWAPPPVDPVETSNPKGIFGLETPAAVRTYRLEYGYGIAQQIAIMQQAEAQLSKPDPHADYLAALSEEQRREYALALDGDPQQNREGCASQAAKAVGRDPHQDGELATAYIEVLDRLRADPRYVRLERETFECLAAKGHAFSSPEQIDTYFQRKLNKLTGATETERPDGTVEFSYGAATTDAQPILIDLRALERLRKEELATARDEVLCRDRQAAEYSQVVTDANAPFVARFGAQIDRLAATYRATIS